MMLKVETQNDFGLTEKDIKLPIVFNNSAIGFVQEVTPKTVKGVLLVKEDNPMLRFLKIKYTPGESIDIGIKLF